MRACVQERLTSLFCLRKPALGSMAYAKFRQKNPFDVNSTKALGGRPH